MRQKKRIFELGLTIIAIVLISSLVWSTKPAALNVSFPATNLQGTATGDLQYPITDFTGWEFTDCYPEQTNPQYLILSHEEYSTVPLTANAGYLNYGDDDLYPPDDVQGTYQSTFTKDDLPWYSYTQEDWEMCALALRFDNPNSNRQYRSVTLQTTLHAWSAKDWSPPYYQPAMSCSDRTTDPYRWTASSEEARLSHLLRWLPWERWNFHDKTDVIEDTTQPTNWVTGQLGGTWQADLWFVLWHYQRGYGDDSLLWIDHASVEWTYSEYKNVGTATSPTYTLGDIDHTYKNLNSITFSAPTIPSNTNFIVEYSSLTPVGWSAWIPITSGSPIIGMLSNKVQIRMTLSQTDPQNQKTPYFLLGTDNPITINYGDPSPASAPIITEVQQLPGPLEVGYKDIVTVSCYIETYAPLVQAVIKMTTDNWNTFTLYDMYDSFGFGKTLYTGEIPAQVKGTLVQYKIFAENKGPDEELRSATSDEYPYTVIDNVPPNIIHVNNSDWVSPLYPLPSTSNVLIECMVEDVSELDWVGLTYTITDINDGITTNFIIDMDWDEISSHFWSSITIPLNSKRIDYNISARDKPSNFIVTQNFSITIDRFPPTVISWEIPTAPEYDDPVLIWANITDPNADLTPGAVSIKWTINNWVDNDTSKTMVYQYGDTWRINLPPLSPQAWHTIIQWEITATDLGGNTAVKYFSCRTEDYTKPKITHIEYTPQVVEGYPCIVNITVDEPGSGIDLGSSYLLYCLSSEGYSLPHYLYANTWDRSGSSYGIIIPAQNYNETVVWYIHLADRAQNPTDTSGYAYVVIEKTGLINWINFIIWIFIILFITGAMVVGRRHARSTRLTGSRFVGLGAAFVVAATAIIWMTPISWWNLHNLSFFDYIAHLGGSEAWTSTLIVLFGMFFIIAASMGALYYADRRATERRSPVLQQIEEDLSRL